MKEKDPESQSFELPTLKCERCSHRWIPRRSQLPRVCPKCKSPYWDVPKTKKTAEKSK